MLKNIVIIDSPKTPYVDNFNFEREIFGSHVKLHYQQGIVPSNYRNLERGHVLIIYHGNCLKENHINLLKVCHGIVAATSGYDNIDIKAASRKNIPVCNIPEYGHEDVADHTLMLILACVRKLPISMLKTDENEWDWHFVKGVQQLRDQKLGVIGLGRVGRATAVRAEAFGLKVLFYDPYVDKVSCNFRKCWTLDNLLQEVDILSIHAPLTMETYHMLDLEKLNRMKFGSIIVNAARGPIIKEEDLISCLKDSRFSAVALDVLEHEPNIPDYFRNDPRVILTPHSAFYTEQGLKKIRSLSAIAAKNFLASKGTLNFIINPSRSGNRYENC